MLRLDRRGVEPGSHEHVDRQGRPPAGSGRRPHNRGVVMNPIDHPARRRRRAAPRAAVIPVTPWGKPTRQTRPGQQTTDKFIVTSHLPSQSQEEGLIMARQFGKARSSTATFSEGRKVAARNPAVPTSSRSGRRSTILPQFHRRPHLRRLQRQEARSGRGHREHDRPQVRRIRADARTFHGHAADKKVKRKRADRCPRRKPPRALKDNRSQGRRAHAARRPQS